MQSLGIKRVRVLSNNPRKPRALLDFGIEVLAEIPCEASPTPYTSAYLRTKKERMGSRLSLGTYESLGDAPLANAETQPTDAGLANVLS